jgi:hypothetical protein
LITLPPFMQRDCGSVRQIYGRQAVGLALFAGAGGIRQADMLKFVAAALIPHRRWRRR